MFSVNQKKRENLGEKNQKNVFHARLIGFLASAKERKCRRKHLAVIFFPFSPLCATTWLLHSLMFPHQVTHQAYQTVPLPGLGEFLFVSSLKLVLHPCGKTSGRVCIKSLDDSFHKSVTAAPALLPLLRPPHRGARGESLHHTFSYPEVPSLFKKWPTVAAGSLIRRRLPVFFVHFFFLFFFKALKRTETLVFASHL